MVGRTAARPERRAPVYHRYGAGGAGAFRGQLHVSPAGPERHGVADENLPRRRAAAERSVPIAAVVPVG